MGNNNRRGFLKSFFSEKTDKVKLLAPDGRLVEVDKKIIAEAISKKKASQEEIKNWIRQGKHD